jgi:hypothetical protein
LERRAERRPGVRAKRILHGPPGERDADAMQAAAKVVRKLALTGIVDEEAVADPDGKANG